jgi:hypothetical protein
MRSPKLGLSILLSLWILIWSFPLLAGDHAINVQWTGPANEVANDDCSQVGDAITNPLNYTVQYREQGTTTWLMVETTTTSVDISNLKASTDYEVRVGAHYAGGTVLCWTASAIVTSLSDQPPQACSSLSVQAIR